MGTEKKVKATDLLDRPIAFHRCFVTITGTVGAALMLSQAVYWSKRTKDDGWFYKTQEDWTEETGLTRGEQEEARKRLKSYGYLEEKRRGMPAKLYYRVNEEAINKALAGEIKELSLSEILENFSTTLTNLSRAGLMRAQKLNVEREFVDYQLVLEAHGAVCHLCKAPINFGPGQKATDMAFDHVLPLNAGGSHTFNNIRPSHVICNARKGDDTSLSTVDNQACLHKTDKPAYTKQTSSFKQDEQDGLSKADYKGTETTSETTTGEAPPVLVEVAPDGITDALEEIYPGHATNFRTIRQMYDLALRLNATAADVRKFPGWLEMSHPKKADSPFAFLDLFGKSLRANVVQMPVAKKYACSTCQDSGSISVFENGAFARYADCQCQTQRRAA